MNSACDEYSSLGCERLRSSVTKHRDTTSESNRHGGGNCREERCYALIKSYYQYIYIHTRIHISLC